MSILHRAAPAALYFMCTFLQLCLILHTPKHHATKIKDILFPHLLRERKWRLPSNHTVDIFLKKLKEDILFGSVSLELIKYRKNALHRAVSGRGRCCPRCDRLFITVNLYMITVWGPILCLSVSFFFLTFLLLFPIQILFILVDSNLKSNERTMSFFELKKSQLPALAIFHAPDEEQDVLTLDEVSVERIQDFCNRFLQRMEKVKRDSCTVYTKLGSCRMMLFFIRLLKKMTSVP